MTPIKSLESIIAKLEKWQARHVDRHDPARHSSSAKSDLMRLLRDIQSKSTGATHAD